MSISQRISFLLAVLFAAILSLSVVGIFGLNSAQDRFEYYQDNTAPSVKSLSEASIQIQKMRVLARDYLIFTTPEGRASAEGKLNETAARIQSLLADYEKTSFQTIPIWPWSGRTANCLSPISKARATC
jgi:methyl-accepting chemotaxis protein